MPTVPAASACGALRPCDTTGRSATIESLTALPVGNKHAEVVAEEKSVA